MIVIIIAYTKTSPAKASPTPKMTNSILASYVWYKDEEMTEETGTVSGIQAEINRLSQLFPGYTFSSHHTMGLYEYEYGDHYFLPTAIIYSDR